MKSFSKIMIAGLLAGGLSVPAFAQASDTESATASADIIQAISMTKVDDLDFGVLVRPTSGSATITINEDTGAITTGTGGRITASTISRARFDVTGEDTYTANFDADATVLLDGPGADITVTLNESDASLTLTGGAATFYVGGTFSLPTAQTSGAYTGTFNATVSYN